MSIQLGDRLPEGTLSEFVESPTEGCALGPNVHQVQSLTKGKRVVIFGVPGAFTPTCSEQHLPGYVENFEKFRTKGIDEIWCFAVNDFFVLAAWGKANGATGKVRMMADGSAVYTKRLGLTLDLTEKGLGIRCQRFSMLVEDGVVRRLNLEGGGKLEVSSAQVMLKELA
ncbi:MAG: peroxiredoxin [Betaproteobacteria bacterium]|nr:peroxiredoxin [Betaproteobacteria bacterium]